jgi:uncharacterized protein involved in outer membrane biogenesis
MKRKLLWLAVGIVVVFGALALWARSAFTGDAVREALARQAAEAIGQPVTLGGLRVSVFPRLVLTLEDVTIGGADRVSIRHVAVGAAFRALLSRRIREASLELSGARIALPLPALSTGAGATTDASDAPVRLESVRSIRLNGVELLSHGRVLRADVEAVPEGTGLRLRRFDLAADDAVISVTGTLTDLLAPAGALKVSAPALDLLALAEFASEFAAGVMPAGSAAPVSPAAPRPAPAPTTPSGLDLAIDLDVARATAGGLVMEEVTGTARVRPAGLTLDPIAFRTFDGRYDGALELGAAGSDATFAVRATVTGVDVARVFALGGGAPALTGRASGAVAITGRGTDLDTVLQSASGTATLDIQDGVVRNLGLLHALVIATSLKAGSLSALASGTRDEPFSTLRAELEVGSGVLRARRLAFASPSVTLDAGGTVGLATRAVDLSGKVQLTEALSQQAGRDLLVYAGDDGKVTFPARIGGTVDSPEVRLALGQMARRAIVNKAADEAKKALSSGLKRIIKR